MGSENFNRQFILLDFADLDNPDFLAFTRSPEFSTYLLMRRHIWRSREPHYMGLHEYFTQGYLACSLDREKMAEWLRMSLVSVSNDITALAKRKVIESLRTGRQNIFVLGRWVEDEGAYFEHFYLDRLYVRSKENLISGLLDDRNKENFTSDDNPSRPPDVKESLPINREGNREMNREENRERVLEISRTRKASRPIMNVDNPVDIPRRPSEETDRQRAPFRDLSVITDYVSDLAREFNDESSLPATVGRATRVYERAGVDLDTFVDTLLGARAVTKQHSAGIRKETEGGTAVAPTKNRMAYFFAVLEDMLGLAERKEGQG